MTDSLGVWGLALAGLVFLLFIVQMCRWIGPYGRICRYHPPAPRKGSEEGISVVVLLGNNQWYLDTVLPKLMSQDYPVFEVVVVELGTSEDFSDYLSMLKLRHHNLVSTRMEIDPRFPLSNKIAYNLGIKASCYERIILTTESAWPDSDKWLSSMGAGFDRGGVVLGYCGMEQRPGATSRLMRSSRLMMSVRYLSAALGGNPYRGIIHNIGFTRKTYFDHRGFGHLNMNLGEDDLFMQQIARRENTAVVIHPDATMREGVYGGWGWWREQRKFYAAARPFYSRRAKRAERCELWSRALFYAGVGAAAILMPWQVGAGAGALWLTRAFAVRWRMRGIRRRLGEPGLGWTLMLYDITEPITRAILAVSSRVRPAQGVWR